MALIPIKVTDAGLAEIVNAEHTGTAPVVISQVGFGKGQYTATADQTALVNEFKRFDSVSGSAVGENIISITITDDSDDEYSVNEVGVYTESGTLFAAYSQNSPIINKAKDSIVMLSLDIVLTNANPDSVIIGDTNFVMNPATTETQGIIEIATDEEVLAGEDNARALTPHNLLAAFANKRGISGYQRLPNGLIMQWGQAMIANGESGTEVVFPTTFPNKCVGVWPVSASGVSLSYTTVTAEDASVIAHNGNGGVLTQWMALGY